MLTITTNQPLWHPTCLVWVPIHVLVRYSKLTSCAGQKRKVKRSAQPTEQEVHTTSHWNPRLIRFLFNQNASTNHGIIQSHRDTTLSVIPSSLVGKLHPFITWFYSLSARKADYTASTCHVIQRKLGCSSNEKNKNAHWMSPKKVGQQLRIGHMWKHFCSKFTPRDYTNYPRLPMDAFPFLVWGTTCFTCHPRARLLLDPSLLDFLPQRQGRYGLVTEVAESSLGIWDLNGGWNLQVPWSNLLTCKNNVIIFFLSFPKWTFFWQNVSENLKLNSQTSRSGKWFPFQPVQSCHVPTLLTLEDWMIQQTLQPKFGVEI